MNVSFLVLLVADVISIISRTEASPRWSWNKSKHKRWTHYGSKTNPICSLGQCVPAWKCPEDAISRESTGSCIYWTNGPWVCCNINEVQNRWTETSFPTNPSTHVFGGHSKQTAITNGWKQKSTTKNYGYDSDEDDLNRNSQDSWNRNAKEKPIPVSSVGDLSGSDRDRFNTPKPAHNPTEIHTGIIRKTTADPRYKQTTRSSFVTRTTKHKTDTSDPRIVFPTESSSWTQKVTKHPAFHTQAPKTPDYKSTTKVSTRSTTKAAWRPSTKYTASTANNRKPTASTSSSWTQKVTKHPAFHTQAPKTTKTPDYKSTTKVSSRSTTKAAWRPSTKYTASTANNRKPTASTRAWVNVVTNSEERRNQGRATSTSVHPIQGHRTSSRTSTRPSSTRTTAKTTKKYRATTPLPNVNTYLCGTRVQNPATNRQGRDVFHSGHRGPGSRKPYERIVGGEEVEPFSWPWVAALYRVAASGGHRFLSAGSLINEHFVLTAAHVFTPDELRSASYVVMLGTHNAQDAVAQYRVFSVLQHPKYEHRYYYHDIALLRLERPVAFNDYVMPVCLPSPDAPLLRDRDLEGKSVTVMGWGDESFGGKSSRVLKEATFPIVPRTSCNSSYVRVASNRFPRGITEEMLCAGDPNGGKDACQGDSGGPLTSMEHGRYTQVGIVSFGYQCGDKEFPGVYTKVSPYLSWIADNTKNIDDYINDYDYRG